MRLGLAALFLALASPAMAADLASTARMMGADVLFLRHAIAPGTGDPAGFRLDDCTTQRNLSDDGRAQARALGDALRQSGLPIRAVLSSQWCRAKDTADLLSLGPVRLDPGLNSFFGDPEARAPTLTKLDSTLATLPRDAVTIMVTHQVVISAVTGHSPASGGAVLYDIDTGQAQPVDIPLD
jgi:broad specificity phosphatase PhoE